MNSQVKHIVFLVFPEVTLLDITGPYEVFTQANEHLRSKENNYPFSYELHSVSINKIKNQRTSSGMIIHCEESIYTIDYEIDILFIPGVPNFRVDQYELPFAVLKWIKEQAKHVRRICSICTGSFFLAQAGILEGKKVTTHWAKCETLSRNYADINVDRNSIFVKDGNIYTSAGISSGMDLTLALIEEDLGKTFALEIARQMVLYLKRPGSQSQYSTALTNQEIDHRPIQDICSWMREHLSENLTIETLAEKALMSSRNFARVFVRETGITPGKYLDKLRVEAACRYLVDTNLSLKEIALLSGLGSIDNMRRIFIKTINISPIDYRNNFSTTK